MTTRIDRHVHAVRTKLTLRLLVRALAGAVLILASLVLLAVLVDRLLGFTPPRADLWLCMGSVVSVLSAFVWTVRRRPTFHHAAVAIDQALGLKEKFSTALYARRLDDPFALAAVCDAERAAENVRLHKQFPLRFPRLGYGAMGMALVALLAWWGLPAVDLFGHQAARQQQAQQELQREEAQKRVEKALAEVTAVPQALADNEAIRLAKHDLEALLSQPIKDPAHAQRTAMRALQDASEAVKQQMQNNKRFAEAQNDAKMFSSMAPPSDEKGPVADAQRALVKGDFDQAIDELKQAADKFAKMDEPEQQKAAQQMQQLAQQLNQMASDPRQQQQMQQKLQQQAGMSPQQAQQASKLMQQAAAGDKQAQQQLQQMAQNAVQQMNNGQGPTPQQQQQIQQMMQQMQAQANSQQQAQQMGQAAQQMAQAMQQMQQQAGNSPQAGQQMAQAQQQMQQMLQQMQAAQQDARQIAAAQQQMQQAAQNAANGMNGGKPGEQANAGQWGQQPGGQGPAPGQQPGPPNFNVQNPGGPGQGDRTNKSATPYTLKEETSPTQDIDGGKVLASFFVKADAIKGDAKQQLKEIVTAAQKEVTDEVDQDHVSGQARKAVKDYFGAIEKDAETR